MKKKKYRIKLQSFPVARGRYYVEERQGDNWIPIEIWNLHGKEVGWDYFDSFSDAYRVAEEHFYKRIWRDTKKIQNQGYLKTLVFFEEDGKITVDKVYHINLDDIYQHHWIRKVKKTFSSTQEINTWIRNKYSPDKITYYG